MSKEQDINYLLNRHPQVKKLIKGVYQRAMCAISRSPKSSGFIERISPSDNDHEYFFGYYDKSPWDNSDRFMLCLRANNTWADVSPREKADILLIDTSKNQEDKSRVRKIAETSTWNVQQSCMLQWLGPDFSSRIIYNDLRDDKYVSVILNVLSGEEHIIPAPVYTVSRDGKTALTLDFSRLYNLRPGYGYYNLPETTKGVNLPDTTAIWKIDLESGEVNSLLSYQDFACFQPRPEMQAQEAIHKVNHLMLSPDGKRCMVLYRWFIGQRKYTRLITFQVDGSDMYLLADDDMVSHCCWKDNNHILSFENKKPDGLGYYLMRDKSAQFVHLFKSIGFDGHPSFSPDGNLIVTDSYPNRARMSVIKILQSNDIDDLASITIVKVFSPFKYNNDTRCDLHPRWNHNGKRICFDAVFEGHRGLYTVDLSKYNIPNISLLGQKKNNQKEKKRILFVLSSCKKLGPVEQTLNIIKNLDAAQYEPYLITLQEEQPDSRLNDYLPYVSGFNRVLIGQLKLVLGRTDKLEKAIDSFNPDIVHTVGLFQDFAVCRMRCYKQITTIRNYVFEDYPAKFGKVKGFLLAKLHLYALNRVQKAITCSESLAKIYKKKLGLNYSFIRNGVDLETYFAPSPSQKNTMRMQLGIDEKKLIFIYTGQIIDRKNIPFMIEGFFKAYPPSSNAELIVLGDGNKFQEIREKYSYISNIEFRGKVSNVHDYLVAGDIYISCSKSEGLPNGVLEAMASGLPVVLSDIEQHREIFSVCNNIGYLYRQGDMDNYINRLQSFTPDIIKKMGENAFLTATRDFSAKHMSCLYQQTYEKLVNSL